MIIEYVKQNFQLKGRSLLRKPGLVAHTCNLLAHGRFGQENWEASLDYKVSSIEDSVSYIARPYLKKKKSKNEQLNKPTRKTD
jgi:hypothetical protein